MASFSTQEHRPIKKQKLGHVGPDVYPQDPKQKEDELTPGNVKHGYDTRPPCDDEIVTALRRYDLSTLTEEKVNRLFIDILQDKIKSNTIVDQGKKKLQLNTRDNFWHVTQGSKAEPWLKDLAGNKPLSALAKKVPIFSKKEDIYKILADFNVPTDRAVWLIKMTNGYYQTLAESRVRKNRTVDSHTEWTVVTKDFLKVHLQKVIEYYQHEVTHGLGVSSILELKYWNYGTQLARHLYQDGLLDRHELLVWFIDVLEKQKNADDTVIKMILAQIIRYLSEFVQSQLLSRRLAHFCCKKLSQFFHDSGYTSPRTQSPLVTSNANGSVTTGSANPQQTLISCGFGEYMSCQEHRSLMLCLTAIVQCVALRCPGALIWHHLGEGKMTSNLSGSPLDTLPCAPSCLPMPYGLDNGQIRSQIRNSEMQIRLRSRMSESRWSSDKCQQSAKGFTIAKVLQVLETLDRQNFSRLETVNFIAYLYQKIFGVLESKENEPPISDECIVNVLCEWSVSTQRTGEYRALVVAKLLERRQNDLNAEKFADDEVGDTKGSEAGSEILANNGTPTFQNILLGFLDNKAPYLDENSSAVHKQAFSNLILLFSELVKHDVFSHDSYMCTLISRGDLTDAPTLRPTAGGSTLDHTDLSSVHSELPSKQQETKMDMDFDVFRSQPTSVKSEQPFSVPTPGPPQTPIQGYGMARTPGAPTTPSMSMGARTPGAPHTPGVAHTPGMAATPLGGGGLTPGHGSATTPGAMHPPTPRMAATPAMHQMSTQSQSEDTALRAKKHFCYAMHLPIAQDEYGLHECNQRMVLLYGFGKARDEVKHNVRKITKEVLKFYSKKNSIDVTIGEVRKKEKKKEKEKDSDSIASYESTFQKFQRLSYYDQHAVTHLCTSQVLEMIQSFTAGSSVYLPLIENVSYLFDLMEYCYNVGGLVEFLVQLLEKLPDVHDQLQIAGSQLESNYTTSLCLCIVSVLRRYHAYLLVMEEYTSPVFENVCKIVKHVGNPADCSSAERCTLAYLFDLFTTSADVKEKYSALFSGAAAKVKAALFVPLSPAHSNDKWDRDFLTDVLCNKQRPDQIFVQKLTESSNRFSFVCNTILTVVNSSSDMDRVNEIAIFCAELTSEFNSLSYELLGVLRALCCSGAHAQTQKDYGYTELLQRVDISDVCIHEPVAVFTSLLVARHCFSLEDLIIHIAIPLALCDFSTPGDSEAEHGARLTCHLLLGLFQSTRVLPGSAPTTKRLGIRCDRHLLDAAHEACDIDAIVAVLKVLIVLSDHVSSTTKKTQESSSDIIQTLMKSLNDDDEDEDFSNLGLGLLTGFTGASNKHKQGIEHAGLAEYARYVLKEICRQEWVREKFLKKPEALLTSDLLLDKSLTHKQAQQLIHMICYPEGVPEGPISLSSFSDEYGDDISDQRKNISRILHNMDQWKLRVAWLEFQLMFKQALPSEMNNLLDNVAESTIEVFTSQTGNKHTSREIVFPAGQTISWSETDKESIWLIAPLIAKLPANVQGKVLKAAGEKLKTGNNFWTAKNAVEKECYIQQSISLMGHQPFLSLVLTCLKGQDEQREGLLKSLHEQLEKFVNNTKEPQDRGIPTDDRLKLMMQESLRLRMSLVGSMFDTIQRNYSLYQEWTVILIQLISHGVVELGNNPELFLAVLDMLSVLLHGTLVPDEPDGKSETKNYLGLVRKLKREIGEKQNDSMDLVRQLLPLPKHYIEVIQTEPRTKKAQGFQIGTKQRISPWDLLEGHKNPAPLSLAWFGGVKIEKKALKYEEEHRLLLYHTHSMKKPTSHYLDPPKLPPEDLEPITEPKDDKPEHRSTIPTIEEPKKNKPMKKRKGNEPRLVRTPTTPYQTMPGVSYRQDFPSHQNWGQYGGAQSGSSMQPGYPQTLPPGGPGRYGSAISTKQAISSFLSNRRMPPTGTYMPGQTPAAIHSLQMLKQQRMLPNPRMAHPHIGRQVMADRGMFNPGMQTYNQMNQGGNFGPGGYQHQMEPSMGSTTQGFSQNFQGGQSGLGMPNMASGGQGYMSGNQGQQFSSQRFINNQSSGMGSSQMNMSGGQVNYTVNSQTGYGGIQTPQQQQRIQQLRQMQLQQQLSSSQIPASSQMTNPMSASNQQHTLQPQSQQTAALINQLQRNMSNPGTQTQQHPPPPSYNQYAQFS